MRWVVAIGRRTSLPVLYFWLCICPFHDVIFFCYPQAVACRCLSNFNSIISNIHIHMEILFFSFLPLFQFVKYQIRCDFTVTTIHHTIRLWFQVIRKENLIFPKCQCARRIWTEIGHVCGCHVIIMAIASKIPIRFLNQLFIKFIKKSYACLACLCMTSVPPHTHTRPPDERRADEQQKLITFFRCLSPALYPSFRGQANEMGYPIYFVVSNV